MKTRGDLFIAQTNVSEIRTLSEFGFSFEKY